MSLEEMTPSEFREKMNPVEDASGAVESPTVEGSSEEMKEEITEEPMLDEDPIEALDAIADTFEKDMEHAPVVAEEVGSLDHIRNVDTLKKMAYYAVFGPMTHEADSIGTAIKGVHMARFETKAQLKQVVSKLAEHEYKLLDILKARPISFEITVKKISEVTIGD
jgi:hypothetical protein